MESHHLEIVLDINSFNEIQEYNLLMFLRHLLGSDEINMKKGIDPWNRTKILEFYYFNERLYTPHRDKILLSTQPYKERTVLYLEDRDMKMYICSLFPSVIEHEKYIVVQDYNIEEIYKLVKQYRTRVCFVQNERELQKIAKYEKIKEHFFLVETARDKENVLRVERSEVPRFFYHKQTLKEKYYLVKSLIKISRQKNLPSCYTKFIVDNLNKDHTVGIFDRELYQSLRVTNDNKSFKSFGFDTLEEALVYNVQLSNRQIHGILLPCCLKFHICYENDIEVEPKLTLKEAREQIITLFP